MKYEFSKHPFDVPLITLEIFLPVSLGGGWSWQAELTQPVQQFIADYLINFQTLNLLNYFLYSMSF
jgi:hypothetical protein